MTRLIDRQRSLVYTAAAGLVTALGAMATSAWGAGAAVGVGSPMPGVPHAPSMMQLNSPGTTAVQPGVAYLNPGVGAAQQVGMGGSPGIATFPTGFATTNAFAQTGMNQPGQAPFSEGFGGNQGVGSAMNQPGVPDFFDGFGFNRGVIPPNNGANPVSPYPNATVQVTSATAASNAQILTTTAAATLAPATQSFGFYNGFGGGQPDFGFYAGFTTPR